MIPPVGAFIVAPIRPQARCNHYSLQKNYDRQPQSSVASASSIVLYATGNSTTSTVAPTTAATTTIDEEEHAYDVLFQSGDSSIKEPLPPAYTGCPFNGIVSGPKSFYRQATEALKAPNIFSFIHKGQPMVEVSGGKNVRQVLKQEFTTLSSNAVAGISQKVCGTNSLRMARNRKEHKTLRQLVGVPLSAQSVNDAIPRFEAIGRKRIGQFLNPMKMKNVNSSSNTSPQEEDGKGEDNNNIIAAIDLTIAMTMDVTWQQILGLNLETSEEIETFHSQTQTWLKGMYYKEGSQELADTMEARKYLSTAINKKIDQLLEDGKSDGSTIGGLVFATMEDYEGNGGEDDDDGDNSNIIDKDRTLSRDEIIDNCLLLILGGTETTSANLANTLLLMGLHPHIWQKVIDEQKQIVSQYGNTLTPEVLSSQVCPYLDAVLHEVLRILPVTLVSRRITTETIIIDGIQIPKGWGISYNMYLTHQHENNANNLGGGDNDDDDDNNVAVDHNPMDLMKGFQPERWLHSETRPNHNYVPFGAGPRQCPGIVLAYTEMKAFMSLLVRELPRYELVDSKYLDFNQPLDNQIRWNKVSSMITPEDGVRIKFYPDDE